MPDASRGPRILAVTYGLPWPLTEGAKIRDFHLLRELAKSAQVFVLAFCKDDRGADTRELQQFCSQVETWEPPLRVPVRAMANHLLARRPLATLPFYHREFAQLLKSHAEAWQPDSVQIEHSFLAPYVAAIPHFCRTVLSLHNIGELQYRSLAKVPGASATARLKAFAMRGWEASWIRRFDACVTVSEDDAAWVRKRAPGLPVSVIDNGVDCDRLRPLPPSPGFDIVFLGVLGYAPNADAVMQFSRHSMPLVRREIPEARFVVVGRNPRCEVRALAEAGEIELHQDVPDVLPFYRRARVCVVPLRAGGGTRLKILEAMALARPVISTAVGCEGLAVTNEEQLLIADSPETLAAAVVNVIRNNGIATGLTERARAWVEARHNWQLLGGRLAGLHKELAATPAGTAA